MIAPPWRVLSWIALLCLMAVTAAAQLQSGTAAVTPPPASQEPSMISRMWDLFEIDLPKTEWAGQVRFNFQPHFRDLLDKGYLRVPLELRWGVNDHFELNSDVDTYFDHGLRKGSYGDGISELHFGAKYAWLEWLKPTWDTSVGFNSSIPVSRPPIELTDGHDHLTPYIVFGRKVDDIPGLSGFINLRTDFVTASSTPGGFGQNEPHTHSMTATPGFLYDRAPWHYTFEVDGTTTRYIGSGSHDFLTVRPGIIWDLPKALVLNARGQWLAGFSLTFVFGPDGNTVSTGGRLRGELNVTQWFRSKPQPSATQTQSLSGN
jgi:hypothetical protein